MATAKPTLCVELSLRAYLKWKFATHARDEEVTLFGITDKADSLYIQDFRFPKQKGTITFTDPDMDDMNLLVEEFDDAGLDVGRVGSVWAHTHPRGVNNPSGTDRSTFDKSFATRPWSLMIILCKDGWQYAALQIASRVSFMPNTTHILPIKIDWESAKTDPFDLQQAHDDWEQELSEKFEVGVDPVVSGFSGTNYGGLTQWDKLWKPKTRQEKEEEEALRHSVKIAPIKEEWDDNWRAAHYRPPIEPVSLDDPREYVDGATGFEVAESIYGFESAYEDGGTVPKCGDKIVFMQDSVWVAGTVVGVEPMPPEDDDWMLEILYDEDKETAVIHSDDAYLPEEE